MKADAKTKLYRMEDDQVVTTYDHYDEFLEKARKIEKFDKRNYFPNADDVRMHGDDLNILKLVRLFSWLLEVNDAPSTPEEKESVRRMNQFLYQHLKLVDEL